MRKLILTVIFSLMAGIPMSYAQSSDDTYLKQAHEFMLNNDEASAYAMFMKADIRNFDIASLKEFVRASFLTGHFTDALKASEVGIKKDSNNSVFNRLAMFSSYELKDYPTAKKYLYTYFNKADVTNYSEYDYFYAALIYQALGERANSYMYFNKALDMLSEASMLKRWSILKIMSESYMKDQDYENAIKYYKEYLACKSDISFDDDEGLAIIYIKYADSDKSKQMELISKAIDQYRTLAKKYPDKNAYATNKYKELSSKLERDFNSDVDRDIPQISKQQDNLFAVIITNENYMVVSPVPYANNDGDIFSRYCQQVLGIPKQNIRRYQNATYGNMLSAINDIKNIAVAYNGDINVIFYYAGHGIPNEQSHDSYLLPIDADGKITDSCYPLSRLYKDLGELNARNVILFLDACFSGAQRGEGMLISARGVAIKAKAQVPQGNIVVFSAASGDETAYPYNEKNHGLFTYFLLKKLKESEGDCTLGELSEYIQQNVRQKSVVINRKSQTPTVIPSQALSTNWQSIKLIE